MKKLTLLFLISAQLGYAQLQKGEIVPDMPLPMVFNAPSPKITLHQLKGKLVLIEFWATWCGPCLASMNHLNKLQQQQAQKLQVITVTNETPKRIRQYLASRPSTLWFASDSTNTLTRLFPHQLIPHTILLSTEGEFIAATTPEAVTSAIIDSLWEKQAVHLPQKTDQIISVPEAIQTYFKVTGQEQNRFVMQSKMKGLPSARTTHGNDSIFKNRRLTCINLPLASLYQLAYGDVSFGRTIDRTGSQATAPLYCLDLIVPTPSDLLPTLRNVLASRFEVQTKMELQSKKVTVLTITDQTKFNRIARNTSGVRTYSARSGALDQQAITMTDLAAYLENFGIIKGLVVDETKNRERLDIKFSFQPENPQSLLSVLGDIGLGLSQRTRWVDMLVLYRQD